MPADFDPDKVYNRLEAYCDSTSIATSELEAELRKLTQPLEGNSEQDNLGMRYARDSHSEQIKRHIKLLLKLLAKGVSISIILEHLHYTNNNQENLGSLIAKTSDASLSKLYLDLLNKLNEAQLAVNVFKLLCQKNKEGHHFGILIAEQNDKKTVKKYFDLLLCLIKQKPLITGDIIMMLTGGSDGNTAMHLLNKNGKLAKPFLTFMQDLLNFGGDANTLFTFLDARTDKGINFGIQLVSVGDKNTLLQYLALLEQFRQKGIGADTIVNSLIGHTHTFTVELIGKNHDETVYEEYINLLINLLDAGADPKTVSEAMSTGLLNEEDVYNNCRVIEVIANTKNTKAQASYFKLIEKLLEKDVTPDTIINLLKLNKYSFDPAGQKEAQRICTLARYKLLQQDKFDFKKHDNNSISQLKDFVIEQIGTLSGAEKIAALEQAAGLDGQKHQTYRLLSRGRTIFGASANRGRLQKIRAQLHDAVVDTFKQFSDIEQFINQKLAPDHDKAQALLAIKNNDGATLLDTLLDKAKQRPFILYKLLSLDLIPKTKMGNLPAVQKELLNMFRHNAIPTKHKKAFYQDALDESKPLGQFMQAAEGMKQKLRSARRALKNPYGGMYEQSAEETTTQAAEPDRQGGFKWPW